MHVMRDTEAWLSWLEHTVHIREVTGSGPVASTTWNRGRTRGPFLFALTALQGLSLRLKNTKR